jgi:hypothetical protein
MADLLERRGLEVRIVTDISLKANFETKTTLKINELPVPFDSEIRPEPDIEIMRISEFRTVARLCSKKGARVVPRPFSN